MHCPPRATREVTGKLSKAGGSFQIDHPLDPAHKYLYHSFVESPDMMNVYNGTVTLDGDGRATVDLPDWFETLNRDFRYQLTAIGAAAPDLHVAAEVADGKFAIAGGKPGLKVSWQVTGIRQDAWANANRIPVEADKPAHDQGPLPPPRPVRKRARRAHRSAHDRPAPRRAPQAGHATVAAQGSVPSPTLRPLPRRLTLALRATSWSTALTAPQAAVPAGLVTTWWPFARDGESPFLGQCLGGAAVCVPAGGQTEAGADAAHALPDDVLGGAGVDEDTVVHLSRTC